MRLLNQQLTEYKQLYKKIQEAKEVSKLQNETLINLTSYINDGIKLIKPKNCVPLTTSNYKNLNGKIVPFLKIDCNKYVSMYV